MNLHILYRFYSVMNEKRVERRTFPDDEIDRKGIERIW